VGKALICYQKGLEVDDLAEELYRRLMICHRQLGQVAEALVVYHRCRRKLSAVLRINPSPETDAVSGPSGPSDNMTDRPCLR
jgi:DNA-binding SARP family transcriptional activator